MTQEFWNMQENIGHFKRVIF